MKHFNRFWVYTKRLFSRKSYIFMLVAIILLTAIYKLLPLQKQTTDIRVGICWEEDSSYLEQLFLVFEDINTMYNYYIVDTEDKLVEDVQSGYAECGFYVPEDFIDNYILGITDTPVILYNTPSSTVSSTISETFFSCMLKIVAPDILTFTVDMEEYNDEMTASMLAYFSSDSIFTIESLTDGEYNYQEETYRINIPVYEVIIVLTIFSSLLGLLIYMQDKERHIYVSLPKREQRIIMLTSITTSILPIILTGIISLAIAGSLSKQILSVLFIGLASLICTIVISLFIRKSTLLLKVLPLTMLISIMIVFINNII